METVTCICLDVYYYEDYAKASGVVFQKDQEEKVIAEYNELIYNISEYIPGQFYKRELPCLMALLEKVKENIDFIIVDSFVWLEDDKKGLGAYLYEALRCRTPVIGVAKTFYTGSRNYIEIHRGNSSKPLYISSAGIDVKYAEQFIKGLDGEYRIPYVLKLVDKLSRGLEND
jgi:deoxyribonuclease V